MKRCCCLVLALLCLLCACAAEPAASEPVSLDFFAMDTFMTIRAYGTDAEALSEARSLVEELEAELSVTRTDSAIHALNTTGTAQLSPTAAALLRRALELCALTDGALDLSIYPVLRAWGFTTGAYRVPTKGELDELLTHVDYRGVAVDGDGRVTLSAGMEIDLGSVTKGYTGDRICALLREKGVESALLDLGGNVQALGGKPDGSAWRVGVRDPQGEGLLGAVSVRDEAVVTSGGYERCFTDEDGNLWWHILDPADGYPAKNGLLSATVVGSEGVYCDALSTALFVMGEERAVEFWRERRDFEMVLVTEDGRLLLTPALSGRFTPTEGLRYRLEVIADA